MRGLLLKDLLNLRKQSKVYLLLIVFYSIIGFTNRNTAMFGGMISIVAAMIPITALAYDERSKWDGYALTMPLSRGTLVLSRYILGLIFIGAASILSFAFSAFLSEGNLYENLMSNLIVLAVGIILMSVIIPLLFKYGVEKGRILMMVILFAPTGLIMLLPKLGFAMPNEETLISFLNSIPVIAVILLVISVFMSISIYKKKEF